MSGVDLPGSYKQAIAIVGLSCAFPGALAPDAFWDLLSQSRRADPDRPQDRPRQADGAAGQRYWLEGVDRFDAAFFSIAPLDAEHAAHLRDLAPAYYRDSNPFRVARQRAQYFPDPAEGTCFCRVGDYLGKRAIKVEAQE